MDFRIALRSLCRTPAFTLLAIGILSLGIGANTAIFSVVHAIVFRALPYRDSERIVSVSNASRKDGAYFQISGPDFVDFRAQSTAFDSMAAYDDGVESIVIDSNAEFAGMAAVSEDFLRTLGMEPIESRAFTRDDWSGKLACATPAMNSIIFV